MQEHKGYDLVNIPLSKIGKRMPHSIYKEVLINWGFSNQQAIGSIGGAISAGTVKNYAGILVRVK